MSALFYLTGLAVWVWIACVCLIIATDFILMRIKIKPSKYDKGFGSKADKEKHNKQEIE